MHLHSIPYHSLASQFFLICCASCPQSVACLVPVGAVSSHPVKQLSFPDIRVTLWSCVHVVEGKNGTVYPTFAGKHIQNINTLRPTPRWTGCHQYELNIKQRGLKIYDWHWIQVIKSNSTCLLLLSQDLNSQSIEWPWIAMNNLNIYHIMLYTLWLIMYIHIYIVVYIMCIYIIIYI